MPHMNIVKFHVKPELENDFFDAFQNESLHVGQVSGQLSSDCRKQIL